jgi:hypothetical protein
LAIIHSRISGSRLIAIATQKPDIFWIPEPTLSL